MAHILVVEDDPATREYLGEILQMEGFECMVCSTAEEASVLCNCWSPDLAIVDINLPGKHGVTFSWEFKQQYPETPVLILSAVLGQWDTDDLCDCGANAILQKPCQVDALLSTTRDLLSAS